MKELISTLIELVFPIKCTFCNGMDHVCKETNVCRKCLSTIPFYKEEYRYLDKVKINQNQGFKNLTSVYCLFEYSGIVKRTFINYKFNGDITVYKSFAMLMHRMLQREQAYTHIDFITAVPISREKFAKRGFNQSALLAKRIAELAQVPYEEVLTRPFQGQTQSKLTEEERLKTSNRFKVRNGRIIENKNILVVDDILTSGSTLNEVAQSLLNKGAASIRAAVFASSRKDI